MCTTGTEILLYFPLSKCRFKRCGESVDRLAWQAALAYSGLVGKISSVTKQDDSESQDAPGWGTHSQS